jgi:hypothetical protein
MPSEVIRLAAIAGVTALLGGAAIAQDTSEPKPRSSITDLVIGSLATEQPGEYQEYACGTNGGPPSIKLTGFADFAQCALEAETGLHEVDFQYDDEIEYWALANNLQIYADRYHGTKYGNYEIIASALFDDHGVLRGYRALTDDRVTVRSRFTAYQMSEYVLQQYSPAPWIKQNCKGTTPDGTTLVIETRLLRRAGQKMVDPFSGVVRGDRFVASSRFEVLDPSVPVPDSVGVDR